LLINILQPTKLIRQLYFNEVQTVWIIRTLAKQKTLKICRQKNAPGRGAKGAT